MDSDALVAEVKKVRGKKKPLTAAALKSLREEHTRTIEPARSLKSEAAGLERQISDLVNAAYGLTPANVALLWQTPRLACPTPRQNSPLRRGNRGQPRGELNTKAGVVGAFRRRAGCRAEGELPNCRFATQGNRDTLNAHNERKPFQETSLCPAFVYRKNTGAEFGACSWPAARSAA